MRRDMFQVIIERPRLGGGWSKKQRTGERTDRAFERAPAKVAMSRTRGTKELNENLAPLRRFLASRMGRPWNAVHSEICAVLSMGSAVQKHVLDHVKQYVEENPLMIDGQPHDPIAVCGRHHPLCVFGHRWRFYVCPRTGLLRRVACERRKPPRKAEEQSTMDAGRRMGQ